MSAVQQNEIYSEIKPIDDLENPLPVFKPNDISQPDLNTHYSLSTVVEVDDQSPGADTIAFSWNDSELLSVKSNMAKYETVPHPLQTNIHHSADETEITDSSIPYSPYSRSHYEQGPNQTEDASNRTHYETSKIITVKSPPLKVIKPRKYMSPTQTNASETKLYVPNAFNSFGRHSNRYDIRTTKSDGVNNGSPYDYWTIPRNPLLHSRYSNGSNLQNQTPPGGYFLTERLTQNRSSHRSGHHHHHHHHKHRRDKKTTSKESNGYANLVNSGYRKILEQAGIVDAGSKNDKVEENCRSELKVYFRFSRGTLSDPFTMDFNQNEELLLYFQAQCRGWLAREKFKKRKIENEAIKCIQRNANVAFDKWLHLLFALKPLIKTHRTEEELLFLRSELERYKSLVRMLRFENAEYQAKVANLLQLLEQINTGGSNNNDVNKLVNQISQALTKNQEFWAEMAEKNKSMQVSSLTLPSTLGESDTSPRTPRPDQSPMTKLKQDADFYRDQVELLREEADEQHLRSVEHHQSQVGVLAKRVEELQDMLTMESNKVERLTLELEDRNNAISEAKTYERSLEHMVNQLSRQLEQRSKSIENLGQDRELTNTTAGGMDYMDKDKETLNELQHEVAAYRDYLNKVKKYLKDNPDIASVLNNTPLKPGGELDLAAPPSNISVTYEQNKFVANQPPSFPHPSTPTREDALDLTPRSSANHEVVELRRKLAALQGYLVDLEERAKNESDAREELENENYNLNDRVISLDRQVRHAQDELEEMVKRDMTNQRTLKDLQEQLDEELRKASKLQQVNTELEQRLAEQRLSPEPEDDLMTKELESIRVRFKKEALYYKTNYEQLRDEFDQYRLDHDTTAMQQMIEEKDEKLAVLEKEKQHWRMEMDIQQVKLQNATSLLEDTEVRLKMLTRERTAQMHRMAQLETERDEAIREAATVTGRATADKEMATAKFREMDELRIERDMLRKELSEVKQALAGSTAENNAERRQLQARLREIDTRNESHINDLRNELERMREEIERLQDLLRTTQDSESNLRSSNQHQKWKISELEDQISHYVRRVGDLERQRTDLDAELSRARADLTLPRETASLRRASQKVMADEWLQLMPTSENDLTDEEKSTKMDESLMDDYTVDGLDNSRARNANSLYTPTRRSNYRSNPNLDYRRYRSEIFGRSSLDRQSPYRGSPVSFETKHDSLRNLNSSKFRSSDLELTTNRSSPRPESVDGRVVRVSTGPNDSPRPASSGKPTSPTIITPTKLKPPVKPQAQTDETGVPKSNPNGAENQ